MGMRTEIEKSIQIQKEIHTNKEERLKDYFDKNLEDQYIAYVKERIMHTIIVCEELKEISVTVIPFPHIGLYFDMGTEKITQTIKKTKKYFIGNEIEVEIVDDFPNPKHVEYKVKI
ncbi:hypothetical protein [Marinisporobacter balticus]|uniref:Uncharacterized protein n=1 Tax=Marinisporobacter balticus TaxID=2018667 RepID=A0A4R2KFC5_9FIRM|nr:hypothetical protein [Marinisporobacter balticus]TCO72273.1 hypothetical protein EV214_11823 [Marinisporobacter balticus]